MPVSVTPQPEPESYDTIDVLDYIEVDEDVADYAKDSAYLEYEQGMKFGVSDAFWYLIGKVKTVYQKASNKVDDEFSLPVSQNQLNAALEKFVTKNVKQILEIRMELHDDWFRLFCTIEASGIYAEVASNFHLVQAQLDGDVQRFVFAQQTNTDLLNLRCDSFLKRTGIKLVLWFYHSILHKDPLGFILSYINIVKTKDNVLYLDINRWLKKNKKIMSTLQKVQINYGLTEEEQLTLKTQVNVRDIFINNGKEDIVTPDDEPELMKGEIHPIADAIDPSKE